MNIDLSCTHEIPYLLIEHETGISYCGQVGGVACLHPQVEGFIIPLRKLDWEQLEGVSCPSTCTRSGLSEETVIALKKLWPTGWGVQLPLSHVVIELDEERIADGTECWFPVRLRQTEVPKPYSCAENYSWLDGKRGFLLMYDNCD